MSGDRATECVPCDAMAEPKPGAIVPHAITADLQAGGAARERALAKILSALREEHGNVTRTATALGVGRATLIRWLAAYPKLADAAERLRIAAGQVTRPPAEPRKPRRKPRKPRRKPRKPRRKPRKN